LLDMEKNNNFRAKMLLPDGSFTSNLSSGVCSFDLSYISSYLFVRGCIETLEAKFSLNKINATQKFLELIRSSACTGEWLIFDIANALDVPKEELLNGKSLQIEAKNNLKVLERAEFKLEG